MAVCSGAPFRSVHPRVRGERSCTVKLATGMPGSSPRARGTGSGGFRAREGCRFIPACAGNGLAGEYGTSDDAVHPRVRGERFSHSTMQIIHGGSSPRARGTDLRHGLHQPLERFIPACAGNGSYPLPGFGRSSVHPRVRGERASHPAAREDAGGSSPRARGTVSRGLDRVLDDRFIPACAGNGKSFHLQLPKNAVHPRVRGERRLTQHIHPGIGGSSPRARGTGLIES